MITKIAKRKLIEIITENKDKHEEEFKEAYAAYRRKIIKTLEDMLQQFKDNVPNVKTYIDLQRPQDYTKEYDTILSKLNMTEQNIIDLEDKEYQHFVMDDWAWTNEFKTLNSSYTGK